MLAELGYAGDDIVDLWSKECVVSEPNVVISVDRDKCMGSGVCSFHAPATFDLDDANKAFVVGVNDPIDAVRNAVESCPQRAITLTENQS